jgi:hypothetical protein
METASMSNSKAPKAIRQSKDLLARIAEYRKAPESMTLPQRIAHFLNWAADNIQGQYFGYNIVCKSINGYAHTPREGTVEVESVRKSMQAAKRILIDFYKRTYDFKAGLGVRACYSDDDAVKHSVARAAKRVVSSKVSLDKVASVVNPEKLSAAQGVYFRNVTNASKAITTTHIKALLPPASSSDTKSPKV